MASDMQETRHLMQGQQRDRCRGERLHNNSTRDSAFVSAMTDQLQVLQERTSPGSLPDPFPGYTGIFTYEVDNTQAGQVIVGGGVNSVTWTLEHSGLFVERIRCCAAIIY